MYKAIWTGRHGFHILFCFFFFFFLRKSSTLRSAAELRTEVWKNKTKNKTAGHIVDERRYSPPPFFS